MSDSQKMLKFDGYWREILLIAHERYSEAFVLDTICLSPTQLFSLPWWHFITKS